MDTLQGICGPAGPLLVRSTVVLTTGYHPHHSVPGIIWTAVTAVVMFTLAAGKARTGRALDSPVLQTEGRGRDLADARASGWSSPTWPSAPDGARRPSLLAGQT